VLIGNRIFVVVLSKMLLLRAHIIFQVENKFNEIEKQRAPKTIARTVQRTHIYDVYSGAASSLHDRIGDDLLAAKLRGDVLGIQYVRISLCSADECVDPAFQFGRWTKRFRLNFKWNKHFRLNFKWAKRFCLNFRWAKRFCLNFRWAAAKRI
jgi:hypothetical protein